MNVHGPFSKIIDASIPDGQFTENILRSHVGFSHQLTISPPHPTFSLVNHRTLTLIFTIIQTYTIPSSSDFNNYKTHKREAPPQAHSAWR